MMQSARALQVHLTLSLAVTLVFGLAILLPRGALGELEPFKQADLEKQQEDADQEVEVFQFGAGGEVTFDLEPREKEQGDPKQFKLREHTGGVSWKFETPRASQVFLVAQMLSNEEVQDIYEGLAELNFGEGV